MNKKQNSWILLTVLLIILALVAWSCLKKSSSTESYSAPGVYAQPSQALNPTVDVSMPLHAVQPPNFKMIYDGLQDYEGWGPGASWNTTNEITLQ